MADTTDAFDNAGFDPSRFQPARPSPPSPPDDWGQAFAALPAEDAPPEAWASVAARLPATTRRARSTHRRASRVAGIAAVAGVAACALMVALLWPGRQASLPSVTATSGRADVQAAQSDAAVATAAASGATEPGTVAPLATAQDGLRDAAMTPDLQVGQTDAPKAALQTAARMRPALPAPARGERPRRRTSPQRPAADAITLPVERRMAAGSAVPPPGATDAVLAHADGMDDAATVTATDLPAGLSAPATLALAPGGDGNGQGAWGSIESGIEKGIAGIDVAGGADEGAAELGSLQARSQRLEYLLGQVRDTSVGTGPGALLAAELDERLARIDTALAAAPSDQPASLGALWQARVDALERALAFESRLRALAAEGRGFDGALVGVD